MHLPVPSQIVADIWAALDKPDVVSAFRRRCRDQTPQILREAGASGWTGIIEVETVLSGAGICPFRPVNGLLADFDIAPQLAYRRPTRGRAEAVGCDRIAAADLAHLVVLLERAGLPIDPAPLCDALRPGLKSRAYLTATELAAYWHARERHRCEPLLVTVPSSPRLFEEIRADADVRRVTAGGYRADVWFTEYDPPEPYAIRVEAPRWRGSRRSGIPLAA